MVLTNAQTTAFFENGTQMAIPHATVMQLSNERIAAVNDLVEFDRSSLQQITGNLQRPGGQIPNPTLGEDPGATIPTQPFVFGAKSQERLKVACNLIRFYETIGRPLTASNIAWDPLMRLFGEIWKSTKENCKANEPNTPKINKSLPIMKWMEAFRDHLHRCVDARITPLA